MTTELSLNTQQIVVVPGKIEFQEYERLLGQAQELAMNIESVEVTEENVKISKKMLAAVNKKLKELEDARISIKKEILSPYADFEAKVKNITNLVREADETVRSQVRTIEERERYEKHDKVATIFEKRMNQYPELKKLFTSSDFIKPKHLNKTTSLNSVESEMVEWLEKKEADLKVIQSLPNSESVLSEYLDTKDLTTAINIVNQREERKQKLADFKPSAPKATTHTFVITIEDEKDFLHARLLLTENNIQYKSEKVGM